MITLERCAMVLNRNGKQYSDEEIKQIRDLLYNLARIDEIIRTGNDSQENSHNLYAR